VLDLGCGSGENFLLLVRRGARVHGVDISEALVTACFLRRHAIRHAVADPR
jgi:cyclopropane fatty-acyl-phospholipid synthase-like methyltransferase